jgi:hypothetical protein
MEWETIGTVEDFLAWLSDARETPYRRSLEQARQAVVDIDPAAAAKRCGASYRAVGEGAGAFTLPFLGQKYTISYPGFKITAAETGREPSVYRQIIMLHYLKSVDDAYVPTGFVSFGGLPHGRPYEHALQTMALESLARAYADHPHHFRLAAQALGGRPLKVQNSRSIAFSFWPLPRLPMGVALTPGDAEFSIRAQLLVDVNTEQWLPIYDAAIVGRLLCQTLQQLKPVGGRAAKMSEVLTGDDGALYGAPS